MRAGHMRAVQCPGPGRLELAELPIPEPAPGEARVRIQACGICGSDLHLLPVGYMGECIVPGHEMTGEVASLGEGVDTLRVGDRVVVEPLRCCGTCPPCRRGQVALCAESRIFGVHANGGFAEFACVPASCLYPVGADVGAAVAAMAEPIAVTVHGVDRAGVDADSKVLVLGAGTLGLLSALIASERGAEVWISARYPHQAELARALGASHVLGEQEASEAALEALSREAGITSVIEAIGGGANSLPLALAGVGPGGTISVLGMFTEPITLPHMPLFLKEATLAWSNCYQRGAPRPDFAEAVRLIETQTDALSALTTHQVALDGIEDGFGLAGDRRAGAVKVSVLLD